MVDLSNWPHKPEVEVTVTKDPTRRIIGIQVPGRFDTPFRDPHEGKVPMQPPGGIPGATSLIFPDGSNHPFRASRLYPAYVDEVVAARLQREHKWEPWVKYKAKTLDEVAPERPTVKMLSPKSQASTTVEREDGTHPLYPAGGSEHEVDARDQTALEHAGWRQVLTGPTLPTDTEKLCPGTRFVDSLSDAVYSLDGGGKWDKL